MNDIVKTSLFVTFILSTTWKSTNGYNIDYKYYLGHNNLKSSRLKRQSSEILQQCTGDPTAEYKCATTDDCINVNAKCNGKIDCPDGSDEQECTNISCSRFHYKCAYGACIDQSLRCNGVKDCIDNSDEFGCAIKTSCSSHEFKCTNGQCITLGSVCDAHLDCEDKSDETKKLCISFRCPNYAYRCKYGACLDQEAKCNNIQDCPDNSDEQNCGGKETFSQPPEQLPQVPQLPQIRQPAKVPQLAQAPQLIGSKCVTPPQPQNGKWMYADDTIGGANENVVPKTIITFLCNPGYKLSSSDYQQHIILCKATGEWTDTVMPKCEKLCRAFENTEIITYTCKKGRALVPCDQATDLTVLTFECAPYYEIPIGRTDRSVCYDGTWDFTPECVTVCGEKRVSVTPLIINGISVKRGDYPWVVALYSKKDTFPNFINVCGGSLLTPDIVLTAAHCVTYKENGNKINQKFYRVGVGKYYNQYEDEKDRNTAQYAEIENVVVNPEYKGEVQNFRGDIALLKLTKQFILSEVVQPVCFQYLPYLRPGTYGLVTGWGFTSSSGEPSDILKELRLPYNEDDQCFNDLEQDFASRYFLPDKMCAGFSDQNRSVCKGDSGSGLVFKNENYRNRFFIHGIVSLGHSFVENQQTHCNVQRGALFTRVEYYLEWIQIEMKKWTRKMVAEGRKFHF